MENTCSVKAPSRQKVCTYSRGEMHEYRCSALQFLTARLFLQAEYSNCPWPSLLEGKGELIFSCAIKCLEQAAGLRSFSSDSQTKLGVNYASGCGIKPFVLAVVIQLCIHLCVFGGGDDSEQRT